MDLTTAIKQLAKEHLDYDSPTDVLFGTYTGSGLKLDEKPDVVDADMLVIPQRFSDYDITVELDGEEKTVKVKGKLKAGDRVLAIQHRGNQKYSIIDKIKGVIL